MKMYQSWRRYLLTGLIVLAILAGVALCLGTSTLLADPVRLRFVGVTPTGPEHILVVFYDHLRSPSMIQPGRVGQSAYVYERHRWVDGVLIRMRDQDLDQLQGLVVTIGEREYSFTGPEVRAWQRDEQTEDIVLSSGEKERIRASGLVLLRLPEELGRNLPYLNWPEDAVFYRQFFQIALVPCLAALLVSFWYGRFAAEPGRAWARRVLGLDGGRAEPPHPQPLSPGGRGAGDGARWYDVGGWVLLLAALAFLEIRQPYYFVQDDSPIEILPMVLLGCRSMSEGQFPHYNPYVFSGAPLANQGIYALTYPPMLLSYGLARLAGDEYATLDVFEILHLLAGFYFIVKLSKKLGMGALPANLTGLSCVLSGSALIMGRSWFMFIPIFVWLPALFLGLVYLLEKPASWRWMVGMGLAMGLPFHVGFPQLAIYINGFFCLAVAYLIAVGSLSWRRARAVLAALFIGAGVALPLLYQQWLLAGNTYRFEASTEGITLGLPAMLLPFPLVHAELPAGWGWSLVDYRAYAGQFYFFGGLLGFLFLCHACGCCAHGFRLLTNFRKRNAEHPTQTAQHDETPDTHHPTPNTQHLWTIFALLALWLTLGRAGDLWTFLQALFVGPLKFLHRYPWRLMPFVVFFASLAGGLMLERLLRGASRRRLALVTLAGVGLLFWHVVLCLPAFHLYHPYQARIYPEIPAKLRALLWDKDQQLTGRMVSWAAARSADSNYLAQMPYDVPVIYGLAIPDGYNPLLTQPELDLTHLRRWGVRWHFLPDRPELSQSWPLEATTGSAPLREVYAADGVVVKELADVEPLAYAVDENLQRLPGSSLKVKMHTAGLDVDIASLPEGQMVLVNFAVRYHLAGYIDGEGPGLYCQHDDLYRITLRLPRAGQTLALRYQPPWWEGLCAGLALIVLGCGWGYYCRRHGTIEPRENRFSGKKMEIVKWLKRKLAAPPVVLGVTCLAFAVYAVAITYLIVHHEVWRDEVHALSMAREASDPLDLVQHHFANEGHPALWHLLLWLGLRISQNAVILKILSATCALIYAAIFLFRSPFPLLHRALFLFGTLTLYQYAVVARNYGISLVLMFLVAAEYSRPRRWSPWIAGLCNALLANTNVYGAFAAIGFMMLPWRTNDGSGRLHWKNWAIMTVLTGLGGLALVYTAWPEPDGMVRRLTAGQILRDCVVPPFFDLQAWIGFALTSSFDRQAHVVMGLGGVLVVVVLFFRAPWLLAAFFGPFVMAGIFACVVHVADVHITDERHIGILVMYLLSLLWIHRAQDNLDRHALYWRTVLTALFVVLTLHMISGIRVSWHSLQQPFSQSEDAGAFLKTRDPSTIIICEPDAYGEPLPYYAPNEIYIIREHRFGPQLKYGLQVDIRLTLRDLVAAAEKIEKETGRRVLVSIPVPIGLLGEGEIKFGRSTLRVTAEDKAYFKDHMTEVAAFYRDRHDGELAPRPFNPTQIHQTRGETYAFYELSNRKG